MAVIAGRVRQHSPTTKDPGTVRIGARGRRDKARVEALADLFSLAGFHATLSGGIRVDLLGKLLFISGNALAAVARAPHGVTRALPETRALWRKVRQEGYAIGKAKGAPLPQTWVDDQMRLLDAQGPAQMPSLAVDIMAGRPSELEHILGAVVRMAQDVGVAAPIYGMLYACLLPQELKARGAA